MLIPCPFCGHRDQAEFAYGGPARALPELDGQDGTHAWRTALYSGYNPRGPVTELWFHANGCESWIQITRDTVTHRITRSCLANPREREP